MLINISKHSQNGVIPLGKKVELVGQTGLVSLLLVSGVKQVISGSPAYARALEGVKSVL